MINTTELRIGNWVQDEEEDGDIMYVYSIYPYGVELSTDESGADDLDYGYRDIFGIPLTTEFLVKNGYDLISRIDGAFNVGDGIKPIKFVHQLQNIHHAITGEELNIIW